MEQDQIILQNRFFTGTSIGSIESNLNYENNYFLNETGQADKVVDSSNVRAFLSNDNNQKAVKAYYSFLTASTLMNSALLLNSTTKNFIPTAEFKAIYYDDEKLADSFNNYYNSSISRGISSSYSDNPDIFNNSIRNQLIDNDNYEYKLKDVFHNYFFWKTLHQVNPANSPQKKPFTKAVLDVNNGDRNNSTEKLLVAAPVVGEYYFINVFLTKGFTQMARKAFEICDDLIFKQTKSFSTFSQNPADKIRRNNFFNTLAKGIDDSEIKLVGGDFYNNAYNTINNGGGTIVAGYGTTAAEYETTAAGYETTGYEVTKAATTGYGATGYGYEYGYGVTGYGYEYGYGTNEFDSNELPPTSKKTPLIQCFIDPNFKMNENETWSDNPVVIPISNTKKFNTNPVPSIDYLSINKTKFTDSSFVTKVVNEILKDDSVMLAGGYGLSKQGTVYRNMLVDLDFATQDKNETTSIVLDKDILINFNKNEVPLQLKSFVEAIQSAGLIITKIEYSYVTNEKLFKVYTNLLHIDLFLRKTYMMINTNNPKLVHYSFILNNKLLLERTKDYEDIKNFKAFYTPIPIDENSLIK